METLTLLTQSPCIILLDFTERSWVATVDRGTVSEMKEGDVAETYPGCEGVTVPIVCCKPPTSWQLVHFYPKDAYFILAPSLNDIIFKYLGLEVRNRSFSCQKF